MRPALLLATALAGIGLVASSPAGAATELLPDLDVAAIRGLTARAATDGSGRVELRFDVGVGNLGAGPLLLHGQRLDTTTPSLSVDQSVTLDDGSTASVPGVGSFVYDAPLERWGFTPYLAYELRDASTGDVVATSGADIGFCVSDDSDANREASLPGEPTERTHFGCGGRQPDILSLDEGISVGWMNRHASSSPGQRLDITELKPGNYLLVERVNSDGRIKEASPDNNASSAVFALAAPGDSGLPTVRMLLSCPDSATCELDEKVDASVKKVKAKAKKGKVVVEVKLRIGEPVRATLTLRRGRVVLAGERRQLNGKSKNVTVRLTIRGRRATAGKAQLVVELRDEFRNETTVKKRVKLPSAGA